MTPRHQVCRAAIEMIKRFEGFRRTAAELDDGRWTVGYGHTKTARQGAEVSEADAEALLIYDLMEVSTAINQWIYTPLNQNQFDALAAFAFNIGLDNFRQSAVLRRVNEGELTKAAFAMELWRKADFEGERIVVDALVRRRASEKALFMTPTHGFVPAPSPIVRPQIDLDAPPVAPAGKPVGVCAQLEGEFAVAERTSPGGEERTASEMAADAITARLQAILSESEPPEPEPPDPAPEQANEMAADANTGPEAPGDDGFMLTPPAESMVPESTLVRDEARFVERDRDEPELFAPRDASLEEFDPQQVAHHAFEDAPDLTVVPIRQVRSVGSVPALLTLGIVGLAIFSAGIFWGFDAKTVGDGGAFSSPVMIGWGLGLVGIACVATAVYFLLERLGGRAEP